MDGESVGLNCSAYGCPLPGSISNGVSGKLKFYCRFHNGHHTTDFDAITTRIKKNLPLAKYFSIVNQGGPIRWKHSAANPPPGYEIKTGEAWADYSRRLKNELNNAIEY